MLFPPWQARFLALSAYLLGWSKTKVLVRPVDIEYFQKRRQQTTVVREAKE